MTKREDRPAAALTDRPVILRRRDVAEVETPAPSGPRAGGEVRSSVSRRQAMSLGLKAVLAASMMLYMGHEASAAVPGGGGRGGTEAPTSGCAGGQTNTCTAAAPNACTNDLSNSCTNGVANTCTGANANVCTKTQSNSCTKGSRNECIGTKANVCTGGTHGTYNTCEGKKSSNSCTGGGSANHCSHSGVSNTCYQGAKNECSSGWFWTANTCSWPATNTDANAAGGKNPSDGAQDPKSIQGA